MSDTPCPTGSPVVAGYSWCVVTTARSPDAPEIATAGDSTARALDPGLRRFALTHDWRYVQAAQGGCSFARLMFPVSLDAKGVAQAEHCVDGIPPLIGSVLRRAPPRIWVYSDRFAEVSIRRPDGTYLNPGDPRRGPLLKAALLQLMNTLTSRGARVLLVADPPPGQPVDCSLHYETRCADAGYSTRDAMTADLNRIYRWVAARMRGQVFYVSITDRLCPLPVCAWPRSGTSSRAMTRSTTPRRSAEIVPIILQRARMAGVPLS